MFHLGKNSNILETEIRSSLTDSKKFLLDNEILLGRKNVDSKVRVLLSDDQQNRSKREIILTMIAYDSSYKSRPVNSVSLKFTRNLHDDQILYNAPINSEDVALVFVFDREGNIPADTRVGDPKFSAPIANVTIPVGREGVLTCIVHDLVSYKVAWLRVDTQTILTIQNHVITKNHRIGVTHTERRIWQLRIRDVKESDRGWYMCQINTDPMKSQVGYLDVVVPPDILDYPTSQDMIVREGHNITLICAAVGSPEPIITWRRERNKPLLSVGSQEVFSVESPAITIPKVSRHHMGAYLCIASNGVPPTVSKRVMVIVNFPPTIWSQNNLIYTAIGQKVTLECITESHPNSVNYWIRGKGDIVQGGSYETIVLDNIYKVIMKLMVRPIKSTDFGIYKCVAKNSLGESEETIKIHHKTKIVDSHAYQQKSFLGTSINKSDWVMADTKSLAVNFNDQLTNVYVTFLPFAYLIYTVYRNL